LLPRLPCDSAVLVRERAGRTIRAEQRQADRFACALLHAARAAEVVERRGGVARTRDIDLDTLLQAALAVFTASGVDAPVRDIAERAGVGIGTLYRRFPQRADLIVAVFCRQVDECADAAPVLAREYGPGEAVSRWMLRYADFLMAKRGLASALHSGDPAYSALPAYFDLRLQPALRSLIDAAATGMHPDRSI
jgi:AcrR family transcriptional regulator